MVICETEVASSQFFRVAREVVDQDRLDGTFLDALDDPSQKKSLGGVIVHQGASLDGGIKNVLRR